MHRTTKISFRLSFSCVTAALLILTCGTLFADDSGGSGTTFSNIDDITAQDNGTVGWGICSNCAGGCRHLLDGTKPIMALPRWRQH